MRMFNLYINAPARTLMRKIYRVEMYMEQHRYREAWIAQRQEVDLCE